MKTKGLFILLLICYETVNVFGQLSNGLKAYYTFGGNANDMSGQGHNGMLIGTPALTTDRLNTANCAFQFPGDTSTYIKVNYDADFNISPTGAFSICLWYQGGTSDISDLEILFGKNNSTNIPYNDYYLGLYDSNNPAFGGMYSVAMTFNNPPVPDPNWHHLISVYNDRKWYLYENAVLVASDVTQTYSVTQSAGNLNIGRGFAGKIDDIRFYNRALSASEVSQVYAFPASCQTVGIDEEPLQYTFGIFPNPAADQVQISLDHIEDDMLISVFDINGKTIMTVNPTGPVTIINLRPYPNGLYFVKVKKTGGYENRLFLKQN